MANRRQANPVYLESGQDAPKHLYSLFLLGISLDRLFVLDLVVLNWVRQMECLYSFSPQFVYASSLMEWMRYASQFYQIGREEGSSPDFSPSGFENSPLLVEFYEWFSSLQE